MSVTKAYDLTGLVLSGPAAADYRAVSGLAMVRDANGNFVIAGAGAAITGMQLDSVNINETMGVVVNGVAYCKLGGTVSPGDEMEVGAAGVLIKLATGVSVGVCEVGGAIGAIGSVLLK